MGKNGASEQVVMKDVDRGKPFGFRGNRNDALAELSGTGITAYCLDRTQRELGESTGRFTLS